jgi:preprotein translocase subunit SecG
LTTVLYILFILSCIVLIVSVLLQPGKADAGALFSSSVSSTAFGPRGTQSILAKITIGAAAAFMLIGIVLSLPAVTGQRSILQSVGDEETTAPTPQGSPAASPAPAGDANTGATTNTTTTAPAGTTPAPAPATSPATGASPAPSK